MSTALVSIPLNRWSNFSLLIPLLSVPKRSAQSQAPICLTSFHGSLKKAFLSAKYPNQELALFVAITLITILLFCFPGRIYFRAHTFLWWAKIKRKTFKNTVMAIDLLSVGLQYSSFHSFVKVILQRLRVVSRFLRTIFHSFFSETISTEHNFTGITWA